MENQQVEGKRQQHQGGRVAAHLPTDVVDRSKRITFEFDGKPVSAYEGDTVASALYASGQRIFSRSFKYHRPRGLVCVSGRCPNCMMNVDGRPNVRVCGEPVREGMKVKHQSAWPSLDNDFFSSVQLLGRFMPVGFYYKTFINAPIKWHSVEGSIRKMTGIGSIDEEVAAWEASAGAEDHGGFERQYLDADVAVIGGGPAGIAAAASASSLGVSVVLIDEQEALGGHLRYSTGNVAVDAAVGPDVGRSSDLPVADAIKKMGEALSARDVTVLSNARVFGLYESNQLGIVQGMRTIKMRANQVIVATGAYEFLPVFKNNDLPGVILGRGVQRLVNLYGVQPGRAVLIVANNDDGFAVARTLAAANVPIVAYVDSRREVGGSASLTQLKESGVPVLTRYTIKMAEGGSSVSGAVVVQLDDAGRPIAGSERKFACDVIALSTGFETDASVLTQWGGKTKYDEKLGGFVPFDLKHSVRVCGDVTAVHALDATVLQGKTAGLAAALSVIDPEGGSSDVRTAEAREELRRHSASLAEAVERYAGALPSDVAAGTIAVSGYSDDEGMKSRRFVCICEDVVEKDISQAIFEGFDEIETLKRYSTATMGPCQGKMCSLPTIAVCARTTGKAIADTGRTVSRPPNRPVPMGALAGARLHPVKLTPLHYRHLDLGAKMMDMGEWKRPHLYTSVEDEYKAVREAVGIIDVGTLGRLDVRGVDAGRLLDFVYTHIFSKLQVGRSRYGVICDDAGVILDDGTVTRLADRHYFITTTTGNVDFVEQWLCWWATAFKMDVCVTNVTAGLAAVNVAGPKARDLLSGLTSVDLSPQAFPYMNSAEGSVAGVPCIMLRIGFVGETGWEIHFPAEYGEYLWDALMDAGKTMGVQAFGVETQRILRLEKKHVIVGQDTDALSTPYEADMSWIVKFEKDDFIGRAALKTLQGSVPARKIVGFIVDGPAVAHDGDQVYSATTNQPVGIVTSSRFSPAVGKGVGLALVPPDLADGGRGIKIMVDGQLVDAKVSLPAFYDPEGKRLKS